MTDSSLNVRKVPSSQFMNRVVNTEVIGGDTVRRVHAQFEPEHPMYQRYGITSNTFFLAWQTWLLVERRYF